jgi:hypothetical protein
VRPPSEGGPALVAGHGLRNVCGNAFNLSAVGSLAIAGIAGDHAVFIHEVEVTIVTPWSTWFEFHCQDAGFTNVSSVGQRVTDSWFLKRSDQAPYGRGAPLKSALGLRGCTEQRCARHDVGE